MESRRDVVDPSPASASWAEVSPMMRTRRRRTSVSRSAVCEFMAQS
ncbi:Uncharacterised protein [Mycobacteroides abscessus subsp. abscessus]|nr:Uncharacterised protein [Mycobacteroides abscessus subsp. abscessus]